MPTVTLNETPAPQEKEDNVVVDSLGRNIKLRELTPVQESRLFLAVGAENSENNRFMTMYAFPAAMVASIDDDEYSVPNNMQQIEARLALIGHEGLTALRQSMVDAMKKAQEALENAEEKAAKN